MPAAPGATDTVDVARACVAGVRSPRVALVARGKRLRLGGRLSRALPDAEITVVDLEPGMDAVHLSLTAGRPWDLVMDVAGGQGAARRWPVLLHHVRRGGHLAVKVTDAFGSVESSVAEVLAAQRAGAAPPVPGRDLRPNPERDLAALAASTDDLRVDQGWLRATSTVDTLAKVPDAEADAFLRARPSAGRTLTTLPGLRHASRCVLRSSAPTDLPTEYDAPAVSLREYRDVTCLGRQAAYGDGFVLPESYRHPFKPRLRNVAFAEWARRFVRRPEPPTAALSGPAFLVDTYVGGHFGHALTDQLGHLWGWRPALERHPDLRALVFVDPGDGLAGWQWELLDAAGIERDRVVVAQEPTAVEVLVASSPMFGMPAYVHPGIATTYAEVGTRLAARALGGPGPRRLFCSRRPGKRTCHNAAEVEALFEAHGFTVVLPEDHPLPEQVRMVREADVVAGFAGSGMFQIAFAGGPKHVVLVSSESYTASNEYLISSVVGHRLDLVLCRPDVPKEEGAGFSKTTYHSDFTYDDGREGAFLREVLAGL